MGNIFTTFSKLVKEVGLYESISALLILSLHFYIKKMYDKNMSDKQNQINKLAEENKEYREKFIKMIDRQLFKGGKK